MGFLGILAWLLGGLLQWTGWEVFVWPYWHWWADGAFLVLVAVWLKLGAIYHFHLEQQK